MGSQFNNLLEDICGNFSDINYQSKGNIAYIYLDGERSSDFSEVLKKDEVILKFYPLLLVNVIRTETKETFYLLSIESQVRDKIEGMLIEAKTELNLKRKKKIISKARRYKEVLDYLPKILKEIRLKGIYPIAGEAIQNE